MRPFVECLWVHRIADPPPQGGGGCSRAGGSTSCGSAGSACGSPARSRATRAGGPAADARVRRALPPRRGAYLLRTPATELVDPHVALDAIDPRLARAARRPPRRCARAGEALAAFGAELERRLRTAAPPPPAVREAVRMLDDGTATVAETAARTFVSERALQRRFAHDVGYGPKVLQRVLRFQRFMRELAAPRVELARAGLLAGYADQSHLSRETRRLAGLSPRQLTHWQH